MTSIDHTRGPAETAATPPPDGTVRGAPVPAVEQPSGKGAKDENFPVGSFLLPKRLRPHVMTYYNFARAIDDIADDDVLVAEEKIRRLEAMAAALNGDPGYGPDYAKAHLLRESMIETGVPFRHGTDLTVAFIQDCRQTRYQSWDDLIGYCENSANPVGRYLLDLHGEDRAGYRYSDALCTVLQIINHLQDCGDDRRTLDRVYIIQPWLTAAGGAVGDLDRNYSTPALRTVINRMLDGCDTLMQDARALPGALRSRHLAMESAVIIQIAERLIARLRREDPLAGRVALSRTDIALSGIGGMVQGFVAAGTKLAGKD